MLSRSSRCLTPQISRLSSLRPYSTPSRTPTHPGFSRVDDQPYSSSTTERISDVVTTNDPQPPKVVQNVSATNETPVSTMGIKSGTLQESVERGEEARVMQAPDRANTWSRSQMPRERAMRGPRFEQTIMELQVGLCLSRGLLCGFLHTRG